MEGLGIGEVARRSGVAASTIRYYEQISLLPPAKRVNTKRRYDESVLSQIRLIRTAQQAGLSIAEIQILLHDFPSDATPSERWQALASPKIGELEQLIQKAQEMKRLLEQTMQCHCPSLEHCVSLEEGLVC